MPIHGRYPSTAERGGFCLLSFDPGPVLLSLGNLLRAASAVPTILTPGLLRTPDLHRTVTSRNPELKPSTKPRLQVAGLQAGATRPT